MKYNNIPFSFSPQEREKMNNDIVAKIKKRSSKSLSPEQAYNFFTGKGKLHHLSFRDYDNYYDFARAKKEIENGQFFTPHDLCRQIIDALQPDPSFLVADLTCGKGSFFNFLPVEKNCYGCEIDPDAYRVGKYLFPEANIKKGDFNFYSTPEKVDLVIGNPPFNLKTPNGPSQWAYIKKAAELLKYSGIIAVIVPVSFLTDELQDNHKIDWLNSVFHFVAQCELPSDSFNADIKTKLLILQKKALPQPYKPYSPDYYIPYDPETIYRSHIQAIYEFNKTNAAKLHLFTIQQSIGNSRTSYEIKKSLWHIKSNPMLCPKYYKKALRRIEEIRTKKQPQGMKDDEWENIRPTPEKVYRWLKHILKHQNDPKPQKKLGLVKTPYGLKNKAYHPSLAALQWEKSVHELLQSGKTFKPYEKLYRRKQKFLAVQNMEFATMGRDKQIDTYLNRFRLRPKWQNAIRFKGIEPKTIALNEMQKADLGLLLQKRYSILAWEQGGGKSVAGMTWLSYWKSQYRIAFIIAPTLAIKITWHKQLSVYGYDFIHVEQIGDFKKIKEGQVVLISYEKLITLQNFIRHFVRLAAYKIALLVDESDELTNAGSQRSLAARKCFRKAKFKLLTTGTTTRNNINELYPQLELVYNNSTAFLSEAHIIYKTNDNGEIYPANNDGYGKPFPAYRGRSLFKASFCPQRVTVFGIHQDTQDVYNAQLLKKIIAKTIITRKFEEIVGEKKHSIITHGIQQNADEKELYRLLMEEFLTVCYHYYTSSGNSRKEAALRLLRQIKALIKATSTPHLMPNYLGNQLPEKYNKVASLIRQWPGELVTVGATFKDASRNYATFLKEQFPNRKVFYIDGEISIEARAEILELFHLSENGILVCTQQSLKSSVNIPYCNKCIIESLQWNIPKMSQFYFRFIRFDSINHTEVHFVNYNETIEVNLLALLMKKEILNDFIKTTNEKTSATIYDEFGIDLNILDMLITKEWDSEGKLQLRWGSQTMY